MRKNLVGLSLEELLQASSSPVAKTRARATAKRKPVAKPKPKARPAAKPRSSSAKRGRQAKSVLVPRRKFTKWRDEFGDYPDCFPQFMKWIHHEGEDYWPLSVREKSITAILGAKVPRACSRRVVFKPR